MIFHKYSIFFPVFLTVLLLNCLFSMSLASADDHEKGRKHSRKYDVKIENGYNPGCLREQFKDDDGNEVTGQTALWLLVVANLTITLSLIMKGLTRFLPLGLKANSLIKNFNHLQKKYLMKLHYFINPLALCIALFHFLLSSCCSSAIPELGLVLMLIVAIFGLMLKFKVSPKKIKRIVYRLHTSPAAFLVVVLVIFAGHMIVD